MAFTTSAKKFIPSLAWGAAGLGIIGVGRRYLGTRYFRENPEPGLVDPEAMTDLSASGQ